MAGDVVDLLEIDPGTRIMLADGSVVEVLSNPRDGMWVFGRVVTDAKGEAGRTDAEQAVFAHDIVSLAPQ